MERLWTPWRMEYIKSAGRQEGCIFCDLPAQNNDEPTLILARGELSFVIMNKFPYNTGHVMIAPFRHIADMRDLNADEIAEMMMWSQRCMSALDESMRPHGFNVGVNQGLVAGAGIIDHIHLHVVPRWGGDTNYMTTVAGVKVLPEMVSQTYDRLKTYFT